MTDPVGQIALDRLAVQESVRLLGLARGDDWERDTPCAGWTLRRLAAHMTAQHRGFAAAARGGGGELAPWRERQDEADPGAAHRAAALDLLDAFAEPGVEEREFTLPELREGPGPGGGWPGRIAVGFHLVDYVVHAWDVAVTLGVGVELPAPVVTAAHAVALRVPTDPESRAPGAAFAPPVERTAGGSDFAAMLALLGRDPGWRPGATGDGKPQM
ncbi:TIGR03086 family metal-binding protein [Streptomyces sp. NPDC050095]|uniref:TIGR03086 family metal-binding protein n=1 Tax=unclassified Streptomyces TaxID=2593676 RepID=UPI003415BBCF